MLIDKLFPIKVENLHLPIYKATGEATFINLRLMTQKYFII
jgi:hypothetical protein